MLCRHILHRACSSNGGEAEAIYGEVLAMVVAAEVGLRLARGSMDTIGLRGSCAEF